MNNKVLILMATAAFVLLSAGVGLAQSGNGYDLSWWTVDGGGTTFSTSADGAYTLGGTIGQPDANVLQGGDYTLAGGFWTGGAIIERNSIYLPLVLRGG